MVVVSNIVFSILFGNKDGQIIFHRRSWEPQGCYQELRGYSDRWSHGSFYKTVVFVSWWLLFKAVALNCFAQHQNNFPETVKTLLPISSEVLRIKMCPDMILLRCDAPKMGPWFF